VRGSRTIAVILVAIGVQVIAAGNADRWQVWALYALAAFLAAVWDEPVPAHGAVNDAVRIDVTRQCSPPSNLLQLLAMLLAVGTAAVVVECTTISRAQVIALVAWLATLVFISIAAWGRQVSPAQVAPSKTSRSHWLVLLILLVLALFLRTLWLDEIPRVYFGDESRVGMWVRRAYTNGMPNLFTMGWNTWSMLGLSAQSLFGPWLGLSTVSLRLASALFGTLAVLATYLLARELFDRPTALLAAALLTCNRTAIDFSRLGTTHAQVPLLEALTFFAFWRGIRTGSALAYAWCGIFAALCLHSYNAAHVVPLLLLGWALLAAVTAPRRIWRYRHAAAVAVASFVLVTLPWFYYLSDHYGFAANWRQFTWMAHARQVTPQIITAFEQDGLAAAITLLGSQAWKTWLGFTILPAQAYQLGYRGGGMLDHVSGALFVLGLAIALRARSRGLFVLYWWGATAFTGGVLTIDPPAFVRLVGLLPAVCILAALPLRSLLGRMSQLPRLGPLCVVVLLGAVLAENWRTYFVEYGNSSAEETSELVHFVRSLPPESPVYLLGADNFLHFTHDVNVEQFAFDFPERALVDVAEPAHFLPIRNPVRSAPTYLVLGPTQLGIEPYVRELYPHSAGTDIRHKTDRRLFFRYLQLTPEDLTRQAKSAARHGLDAIYERDGRVLAQRIDPQLNFYTLESFFLVPPTLALQSPFHARWHGALSADIPGIYRFEVVAGGPFTVDFGGKRVCAFDKVSPEEPQTCFFESSLGAGNTPIQARWDAWATESSVRMLFQMYWTRPDGVREIVPPTRFQPLRHNDNGGGGMETPSAGGRADLGAGGWAGIALRHSARLGAVVGHGRDTAVSTNSMLDSTGPLLCAILPARRRVREEAMSLCSTPRRSSTAFASTASRRRAAWRWRRAG